MQDLSIRCIGPKRNNRFVVCVSLYPFPPNSNPSSSTNPPPPREFVKIGTNPVAYTTSQAHCLQSYDAWRHYQAPILTLRRHSPALRSLLGFRYPFCNGSFHVSNKGLGNPNRVSNKSIIGTNVFSINITIIIKEFIVRVI